MSSSKKYRVEKNQKLRIFSRTSNIEIIEELVKIVENRGESVEYEIVSSSFVRDESRTEVDDCRWFPSKEIRFELPRCENSTNR